MAVHNTPFDAANTAVRAYLTEIGEHYFGRPFNMSGKKGKTEWGKIRDEIFGGECAYCGVKGQKLTMDHLIMMNRTDFGLHHPGNVVPTCSSCQKRSRKEGTNTYNSWVDHLSYICKKNNDKSKFHDRWKRISDYITTGEYKYPSLSDEEKNAIRIIANNLYERIKGEFDNAITIYQELDKTFSKKNR